MKSRLLQRPAFDPTKGEELSGQIDRRLKDCEKSLEDSIGPTVVDELQEGKGVAGDSIVSECPVSNAPSAGSLARQRPQVSQRPQGRLAVAVILLVFLLYVTSSLIGAFLHNDIRGYVIGSEVSISAPWEGALDALYVKVGDSVSQGDVLAIVEDTKLRHSIARLEGQLAVAQAGLKAEAAKFSLELLHRQETNDSLSAKYYELNGDLLFQQARLLEIQGRRVRYEQLLTRQAVSDEELDTLRYQEQGLKERVTNLQHAVQALGSHEDASQQENLTDSLLAPHIAKIEQLQSEVLRQRELQRRSLIRAPVAGTILEVKQHVGEHVSTQAPLIDINQKETAEFVLYVSQQDSQSHRVGDWVWVDVAPAKQSLRCQIIRLGQKLEQPAFLAGKDDAQNSQLLPVYLAPPEDLPSGKSLPLGSEVRASIGWLGSWKAG